MPPKRNGSRAAKPAKKTEPVGAQERIARLLGLLVVKDISRRTEQVILLRSAGFEISEIAQMLGMTENHVMVPSHHGRKNRGKRKARTDGGSD